MARIDAAQRGQHTPGSGAPLPAGRSFCAARRARASDGRRCRVSVPAALRREAETLLMQTDSTGDWAAGAVCSLLSVSPKISARGGLRRKPCRSHSAQKSREKATASTTSGETSCRTTEACSELYGKQSDICRHKQKSHRQPITGNLMRRRPDDRAAHGRRADAVRIGTTAANAASVNAPQNTESAAARFRRADRAEGNGPVACADVFPVNREGVCKEAGSIFM